MHSATTATGRPLPPPEKALPKNRPTPLSCRAPRQLAARKPHVTPEQQCYIPEVTDNDRRSSRKINRQPRRLESAISHTKQTPAPPINRQQMRTLHPAFFAGLVTPQITNLPRWQAGHYSPTCLADRRGTTHSLPNRHTPRLENAISRRKQTLGTLSSRHFLRVPASHNHRIAATHRPPQAASNNVSNRQWQILEINVNLSKQTIAPRSNRHKNALFFPRFTAVASIKLPPRRALFRAHSPHLNIRLCVILPAHRRPSHSSQHGQLPHVRQSIRNRALKHLLRRTANRLIRSQIIIQLLQRREEPRAPFLP